MGLGMHLPPRQGFQTNLAVPINLLIPVWLLPRSLQKAQPVSEAGGLRGRALSSGSDRGVRGTRVLPSPTPQSGNSLLGDGPADPAFGSIVALLTSGARSC